MRVERLMCTQSHPPTHTHTELCRAEFNMKTLLQKSVPFFPALIGKMLVLPWQTFGANYMRQNNITENCKLWCATCCLSGLFGERVGGWSENAFKWHSGQIQCDLFADLKRRPEKGLN